LLHINIFGFPEKELFYVAFEKKPHQWKGWHSSIKFIGKLMPFFVQ
jgi:hypothetical protein